MTCREVNVLDLEPKAQLRGKATGGGKTTLISYTALAEPQGINIVCSPLNMLEKDMVRLRELTEGEPFIG